MLVDYLNGETNLKAETAQLIFAADRYSAKEDIKQSLDSGALVLIDRYISSGIVYGEANGLPREWCEVLESGLVAPNLTIFLDIDLKLAQTRLRAKKQERFDNFSFQSQVRENYKRLLYSAPNWIKFNANLHQHEVLFEIVSAITLKLG